MPEGVKRTFIHSSQIHIVKELKRHVYDTCRGTISQEYINNSCNKFKDGYLYTKGNEIVGIVLWKIITPTAQQLEQNKELPTKYVFIQLLCTGISGERLGYTMLFDVEKYCVSHMIPVIILEPTHKYLEHYYRTVGFRLLSCYPNKMMTKPVERLLTQSVSKTRRRMRNTRDKRIIQYLLENGESMEQQLMEDMQQFTQEFSFIQNRSRNNGDYNGTSSE